jgi:hypothetical protein
VTTRILYRVYPHDPRARARRPGHATYVPALQGTGRIDNPEHYRVLYASDHPAGAIAEGFGDLHPWTEAMFRLGVDRVRSLAVLAIEAPLLDLDDGTVLARQALRPSQVITRRYAETQTWALRLYRRRRWAGVRWWGYHEASWGSVGIWDTTTLRLLEVQSLTREHPAVGEAADLLARPWRD